MQKVDQMSDADVLASVTDEEIEYLQDLRNSLRKERRAMQGRLDRIDEDLNDAEEAIKAWIVDARKELKEIENEQWKNERVDLCENGILVDELEPAYVRSLAAGAGFSGPEDVQKLREFLDDL